MVRIPWNKNKKGYHINKDCSHLKDNPPHKGFKHSEESKEKNRLSHLGKIPWNKGLKGFMKGNINAKGHIAWNKGKKFISMENHWNWKGGISRLSKTGYYSQEYKNWRKSVFERDNYTCQMCCQKGVYLEAHHIKRLSDFPELKYNINNGITLCDKCHNPTKKKEKEYEFLCEFILSSNTYCIEVS